MAKYGFDVSTLPGQVLYRHPMGKEQLLTKYDNMRTIPEMLAESARKYADMKCFGVRKLIEREVVPDPKTGREFEKLHLGEYEWQTYAQVKGRVVDFASGLKNTGLTSGSRMSIFMNTCAEWQVAANAAFSFNVAVVTIYATLGEEALVYGINETEVTHIVTEAALLPTLHKILPKCPKLAHIIYTGVPKPEHTANFPENITLHAFDAVESDGKANKNETGVAPKADDLAVIMYTSGSTGMPKGVMLSHGNVMATVIGFKYSLPRNLIPGEDVYLGFLPLAHIFALAAENFLLSEGLGIGYGSPTTLTATSPRIKKGTKGDLEELRPTYLAAVPTILDRIRQGVISKVESSSPAVQKVFWAAYKAKSVLYDRGISTYLCDVVVFNKIKMALGGRMKAMFCGGAPLSAESQRFMNIVFGIPVCQGYGLTETCGAAAISSVEDRTCYGKVGAPLCCLEIKLEDWEEGGYRVSDKDDSAIGMPRGEIVISGANIAMGYWKLPEKTAEEFRRDANGQVWFHTGDIGQFHPNGNLQIIDRKKDLVKLQQGEYVSLGKIESILMGAQCVDNVCLFADPLHSYCIALVVPQKPQLIAAAKEKGVQTEGVEYEALCKDPKVIQLIMDNLNASAKAARLARFEIPAKIHLCPELWLPETGLVTASMKLQRKNIYTHFDKEIKAIYQ